MQVIDRIDERAIGELLARDEFFWLDLVDPGTEQLGDLAERFGWHPLALEDMQEQRQRPKLDRYDDQMLIVFYGAHTAEQAGEGPRLVEVHIMVSGSWVVTVRQRPCGELDELRRRLTDESSSDEAMVVYRIFDTLRNYPRMSVADPLPAAGTAAPRPARWVRRARATRTRAALPSPA